MGLVFPPLYNTHTIFKVQKNHNFDKSAHTIFDQEPEAVFNEDASQQFLFWIYLLSNFVLLLSASSITTSFLCIGSLSIC